MRPDGETAPSDLQLKIVLHGTRPPLWQHLVLPSDTSLGTLHDAIQVAFGWHGGHLHLFTDEFGRGYGCGPAPRHRSPLRPQRRRRGRDRALRSAGRGGCTAALRLRLRQPLGAPDHAGEDTAAPGRREADCALRRRAPRQCTGGGHRRPVGAGRGAGLSGQIERVRGWPLR